MKSTVLIAAAIVFAVLSNTSAFGQSFTKGVILVSLTEGSTFSNFSTTDVNSAGGDGEGTKDIQGDRDPITIEYGLSKHFGIGLNMGGDVYNLHPASLYVLTAAAANAVTSELTIEFNWHYFVTKHWDLSAYAGAGTSSLKLKDAGVTTITEGSNLAVPANNTSAVIYSAQGGIVRVGTKIRYYFTRHFGLVWMLSAYNATYNPVGAKDCTVGANLATSVRGIASEVGLNFRIF
jgi:hypothetical protein